MSKRRARKNKKASKAALQARTRESTRDSTRAESAPSAGPLTTSNTLTSSTAHLVEPGHDGDKARQPALGSDLAMADQALINRRESKPAYYTTCKAHEWDFTERYLGGSPYLRTKQWCTTACLVGLKFGLPMDPNCPNVDLHWDRAACVDHAAHGHANSLSQIKAEIVDELRYDRIHHIMEPILGCQGTNSRLFRVIHHGLGYAFAGKGSGGHKSDSFHHEEHIYQRLWQDSTELPLLGTVDSLEVRVPASFGVVEPRVEFWDVMYPMMNIDGQIEDLMACNTFLLLSYHGHNLERDAERVLKRTSMSMVQIKNWCRQALVAKGVYHHNLTERNMLWCREQKALMLIDFECAS
ncbi:hypothetical protein L1887_53401 [Cichorium endivia]|nr:hypothetical protein L1887_53401 [Cichorium endivia]